TPPDKIITGRLGCDSLRHLDSCLLNSLRHGFATAQEHRAQQHIPCQQQLNSASHSSDEHLLSQLSARRNWKLCQTKLESRIMKCGNNRNNVFCHSDSVRSFDIRASSSTLRRSALH